MSKKQRPAQMRPKRADMQGRTKNHRHGTRGWTTWVTETRIAPAPPLGVQPRREAEAAVALRGKAAVAAAPPGAAWRPRWPSLMRERRPWPQTSA